MSGEETVHRFQADFKKVEGTLSVTATTIAWNPKTPGTMDRQLQSMSRVANMLASKAGAAKVSLKLVFKDDVPAGGLHFTFTNPNAALREEDRKTVQDILIPFVSINKGIAPPPSLANPITTNGATPGSSSAPGTPGAVAGVKRKQNGEAVNADSPASSRGDGPAEPRRVKNSALNDLKRKVLKKNPTLQALHHELVVSPNDPEHRISEKEFWEGREALLWAEEIAQAQKPGRQPRLIDDRFGLQEKNRLSMGGTGKGLKNKEESGPQTMSLRPEDIVQIFEEFPVVADAYNKYVPGISEVEFWQRYFQSQLWEQHRASERKTVNDSTARKRDDIFDQYLESADDNIQPKQKQPENVERFLDLSATEEDHDDTVTRRDVTMQAGRERGALPLIRRFNANAARLSNTGRPEGSTGTGGYLNTALPDDVNIYDEIDLEDLRGPAATETIAIDVDDANDKATDDAASRRGVMPLLTEEELANLGREYASAIATYTPAFQSVSIPTPEGGWNRQQIATDASPEQAAAYAKYAAQKGAADAASLIIKDMHGASNVENATNAPLAPALFDQMRSCHTAATEFLRQYWAALLPLPTGALGSATNPKSKGGARDPDKAKKMADYLRSTERKIEAVVHTATLTSGDSGQVAERVRAALAPTLGAVNVALAREKKRLAAQ